MISNIRDIPNTHSSCFKTITIIVVPLCGSSCSWVVQLIRTSRRVGRLLAHWCDFGIISDSFTL